MAPKITIDSLPPVLIFLVRERGGYVSDRAWGDFDSLRVRVLDDLFFEEQDSDPAIYGFTAEPPHGEGIVAVTVPTQVALERVYSHVAEPERLVLNPRGPLHGAAVPQTKLEFSTPADFDDEVVILRDDIPELIGALAVGKIPTKDLLSRAKKALTSGAFYECFYMARTARVANPKDTKAWFYELFSYSFFGHPDDVLALYEEYPERGGSDPHAQLLAARYRMLLNQLNEARTILHTLSFDKEVGALASCELARSFLIDKQFARALDASAAAISKDKALLENYLVRGMAQRGLVYEAGDQDALQEAYKDFERVSKGGGCSSPEALYHAGTICVRLGALPQAEKLLRQSLFQRARVSPRDALIRVLAAQNKTDDARSELSILERVAPKHGSMLREQMVPLLDKKVATPQRVEASGDSAVWGEGSVAAVEAARAQLTEWRVPVVAKLTDFSLLDDFINRFAPDGDFPKTERFSELAQAGHDTVARIFALHLGGLLVEHEVGAWSPDSKHGLTLVWAGENLSIPVENFVKERVLLGASGDNFSSLESLVLELQRQNIESQRYVGGDWWDKAGETTIKGYLEEATWVKGVLASLGVTLTGKLADFEALDQAIDSSFEPGGEVSEAARVAIGDPLDRFISGVGLLIADIISNSMQSTWYEHDRPEGISLVAGDLGRIFPIARMQRRVFLASAADFSTRLSSLAWSVAVAGVSEKVRSGGLVGHQAVRDALLEQLPSIQSFPEHEVAGVVDSLVSLAGRR